MKNTHSIALNIPGGFSFAEAYKFLARFSNECLHHARGGTVEKLLEYNGKLILIRLLDGGAQQLRVEVLNTAITDEEEKAITDHINGWLGLKADLPAFYRFAATDEVLGPLTRQYPGVRIIGIPDLFEALSWAIIGQQINLTFAFKLKHRYVERFGQTFEMDGQKYYLHPDTATVAAANPDMFTDLQYNRKKAEYLITVAEAIENGVLNQEQMSLMRFEDAHKLLCSMRGIGNWTANYVLMKCFHHPSSLPLEDAGLLNALKIQHRLEKKPTFEEARQLTSHWGEHAALATFYMWRSLAVEK